MTPSCIRSDDDDDDGDDSKGDDDDNDDGTGGGDGGSVGVDDDNSDDYLSMFVYSNVHLCISQGVKTPLHIAAVKGDSAKIRLLLDLGISWESTDPDGNTLYHLAARENCTAVLEVQLLH